VPIEIEFRQGPVYIRFGLDWPYAEVPGYLRTTVHLDTGEFRGSFRTDTWVAEWQALRAVLAQLDQQVGQDAEGRADFIDEARIALTFKLSRRGALSLWIDIRLSEDTELRFWMGDDQSYLRLWIAAIDQALAQLPAS
jgi:hypothetical protein